MGRYRWFLIPVMSGPIMRTPVTLAIALVSVLALGACNTVSGAGKDVSSAGKAVTKTAEDVKN